MTTRTTHVRSAITVHKVPILNGARQEQCALPRGRRSMTNVGIVVKDTIAQLIKPTSWVYPVTNVMNVPMAQLSQHPAHPEVTAHRKLVKG